MEIYNLAAQSHVQVSFETPEYTANADALGTLRLLEAIRILKLERKVRFYQASTSRAVWPGAGNPAARNDSLCPRSPHAVAKLYAYFITVNYRQAYGIHASNGILFNHESPLRGETFVTRKITRAVAAIQRDCKIVVSGKPGCKARLGSCPRLCRRHVSDAAAGSERRLCLGDGESHSVREFVELAFAQIGRQIVWSGRGFRSSDKMRQQVKRWCGWMLATFVRPR